MSDRHVTVNKSNLNFTKRMSKIRKKCGSKVIF